ncbi:hypothetical protein HanXRQr2_Chr14g0659491 [Helianthus annuus]|uniref:Uncharacterized protein n=1 Tax=Helianthus annuus TaxID=4232 RepID=A0A9K3H7G6_HELAN|nr:hypothetical protein HanXRQr2_Chr14g0659491 [Helianthus annuus]KAJ0470130.1 hypothetical protein HanIR_Chr14g0715451 [Helianthus annuus]KAJ0841625.1 hypothetical protein HanPSC8_Chr14g0632561 [Helianthus annuus]
MNEPLTNIIKPEQQNWLLVVKYVRGANILMRQTLNLPYGHVQQHNRYLLNQRGVAVAPLDMPGRGAPDGPGSCYFQ